jgi:urease accessory protein
MGSRRGIKIDETSCRSELARECLLHLEFRDEAVFIASKLAPTDPRAPMVCAESMMMSISTRFLQLASPALPVGAYSYSQGLEWAIESGEVKDVSTAQRWIEDHLQLVFARFEAPTYARAFATWCKLEPSPWGRGQGEGDGSSSGDDVVENSAPVKRNPSNQTKIAADTLSLTLPPRGRELRSLIENFIASRESSEPRAETIQVGFSYAAWCREVAPISNGQRELLESFSHVCAPVAAALAACASGLTLRDGLLAYVFGFAENQVMVLAKALPLGQIASQKLLFALGDAVNGCVDVAIELPEAEWSSASPLLAIAQMKHETQYSRLFRS